MITFEIFNKHLGRVNVIVSDEDSDILALRWRLTGGKAKVGKYVSTTGLTEEGKPTSHYLHRIIAQRMGLIEKVSGEGRSAPSIDHINGDKMDNRRENLRLRTRKQQMTNENDGLRSTNTSGVRGVSFIKARAHMPDPWYASVMVDGKTRSLGMHKTLEEAAEARRKWDEENPG